MPQSYHHLFTYHEIRAKLVQIWGEPKTDDEHRRIQREAYSVWKRMPQYLIDDELHKQIHKGG